MKNSEKIIVNEVATAGYELRRILKGLTLGEIIAMIRNQLKMSQRILAQRAGVPQSTISNLEKSKKQPNLATLKKVFQALFCDLLIIPVMDESIENLLIQQARKKAEKRIRYLRGSMNLEKQEPDAKFIEELIKNETEEIVRSSKLWEIE
jgi:transcriptional regulator with XRE-family HTH domain